MSKIYCTAPFNALSISEQGTVRTCCVGNLDILDLNKQEVAALNTIPILKEIQQSMLENKPHPVNCEYCAKHEQNTGDGVTRQYFNSVFPEIDTDQLQLKNVELRWSNLCNLGCMYCYPSKSSIWENRLSVPIKISKFKNYQDNILEWILQNINQIEELSLAGGEPLLMKQNYSLIEAIPLSTRLIIISNLSYDFKNIPCLPALLARPKENTIWNISFENTNQQFEFVRNGASWQVFKNNLEFLTDQWPETVGVSFVYSLFSAFSVKQFMQTISAFGIKKVQMITVYGNESVNMFRMPYEIRKVAAQQLSEAIEWHQEHIHPEDRHLYPLQGALEILEKLKNVDSLDVMSKQDFLDGIAWYNKWNQHKFEDLWPEIMAMTDLYLH